MANFEGRVDKFSADKAYTGIRWGERSKPLDIELTELQKIIKHQIVMLAALTITDGFLNKPALGYSAGTLTLPPDTFAVSGAISSTSENMTIAGVAGLTVYLAVSEAEVSYNTTVRKDGNLSGGSIIPSNGIYDDNIGMETSKRSQRQVQLVTSTADSSRKYIAVASITAGGTVTDLRALITLPDALVATLAGSSVPTTDSGTGAVGVARTFSRSDHVHPTDTSRASAVDVGDKSALATTAKSSLVAAVNELFTSVSDGKAIVAAAITGKGNPTAADAPYQTMADNIAGIVTNTTAVEWTSRINAANNSWTSVCYGNGLFVAVATTGTANRVMTSPDGVNWTTRASYADNQWQSVCYGNGLFVAVASTGAGNRVLTSPDGITWTARTSAADNSWRSVCYGNGLFVAVANTGTKTRVMTSPDGVNWTIRTNPVDNTWNAVCYGKGLFVAVATGGAGNRVMTSPDGINWTIRASASDNFWQSVCYGNGLFVAVSTIGNGHVMTSPDGITWTMRSVPVMNQWNAVTYGNGMFVALSLTGTGNRVMTSPDGINWTIRSSAANNVWTSVCYGNGMFVGVADSGTDNRVMTSGELADPALPKEFEERQLKAGTRWSLRTTPADNTWLSVCYGNGIFVAVARIAPSNHVMTSPDGVTWTARTAPINNHYWNSVCYGNGLFVAVSESGTGNRVMTSPDGINWTMRTSAANNNWRSVCYGNGLFVAVATTGTGNRVMTSPDGITWTIRTSPVDNSWFSVCYGVNAYGVGLFVAVASGVGIGNRVMTSPDGINWTIRTSAADNQWLSVTYGNGMYVAVSSTGVGNRVMTSPNGINWTARTGAPDNNWSSVTYGNGMFVAVSNVGDDRRVMTSPDGINWTARLTPASNYWNSVVYGNGMFVAVANTGVGDRVMTSGEIVVDVSSIIPRVFADNRMGATIGYTGYTFTAGYMPKYIAIHQVLIDFERTFVLGSVRLEFSVADLSNSRLVADVDSGTSVDKNLPSNNQLRRVGNEIRLSPSGWADSVTCVVHLEPTGIRITGNLFQENYDANWVVRANVEVITHVTLIG